MSMRILLREQPQRAIALVTSTHALVFRHSHSSSNGVNNGATSSVQSLPAHGGATVPRCIVDFTDAASLDLTDYRPLSTSSIKGTLGLITINNDVFLCVVSGATRVATVRPNENVERILAVEFFCLNSDEYDSILDDDINPYPTDSLSQDGFEHGQGQGRREPAFEHPCLTLKKLLSSGSFYYSVDFDLTNRLQDRQESAGNATFDFDSLDEGLLWNSYMIKPLVEFRSRLRRHERQALDSSRILTYSVRGFVHSLDVPTSTLPGLTSSKSPSTLTLISRLSCRRAGTRFNSRGIDDDGNVANFVETETVLWTPPGLCFSYAQIRGSVPLFWEQATGLLPGHQKIQITRSPEATQPAFDKHFERLELSYGAIHIINLLSETKPGETDLTRAFRYHVARSPLNGSSEKGLSSENQLLKETNFDFHAETRGPGGYESASMIKRFIDASAEGFAYYLADVTSEASDPRRGAEKANGEATIVLQQEGIFRTNCLDCLDRTNLVQTIVSQMALESFLAHRSERARADLWMRHSTLWADNGDSLSKIYAGTGALKSSFTRHGKMSLAGALSDARKSATRMYINNFADKGRQNTIDMLLGRLMGQTPVHLFDPINDYVTSEVLKRANEFSSSNVIQIWAGTLNLNGRSIGAEQDLSPWLCPNVAAAQQNPEVVAVGFQEIVELSPQQIMSTDPVIRQVWENAVRKTLNKNAEKHASDEYVLLRSGQLVGAALAIFVKKSVLPEIKNVEGSVKKTGMSGMAGNKGAVAIRIEYANTSICFVTAHLAAGFANYEERNRDYRTISHGLRFQRNRSIEDHDTIIWMGDFNYRIGLSDEKVRLLIHRNDLDALYSNDQLNLQMVAGLTFQYYSESRITFRPTYKFNIGTDEYDTSEKARIPAWCDRVLRKGTNLRQINYDIAPLRFSDHRPVYATFQCTVNSVDEAAKDRLSRDLYARRRADIGGSAANRRSANHGTVEQEDEDDDLIGYDSIEPGLPPASSDRRKWWLDNGELEPTPSAPPLPFPPNCTTKEAPARSTTKPPTASSILNPQRPSNPFSPTDKPNWIEPSRSKSLQQRPSTASKSSTSTSATGTAPTASVSRSTAASASESQRSQSQSQSRKIPPPAPPPVARRRSAAAASTSPPPPSALAIKTSAKKSAHHHQHHQHQQQRPPPAVPRKPASLSPRSPLSPSSPVTGRLQQQQPKQPKQQQQQQSSPPSLPRRESATAHATAADKKPTPTQITALMDDDADISSMGDATQWQPLVPQR
ncbi:MAG: hypothetical protein M1825_004742 [Sarcosagium campestre]|nr:MAG: hypothetical protein M1825_004742 [Sarcosagium campestre]